ncbi:hypothetical protein OC844_003732 [Tilletia horrida]|nr:hypothetical protein OC844_003732 [Tilletia horrida]
MVQKLQKIIEEEMEGIGACRIEMPALLSSALWKKTGRWTTMGSELYRLQDRRGSEYLLGPTHEEEVTRLVSDEVHSGRALPVRVFQITTKHRDEPRPRSGLLRTRAFLMKDLYTFDATLDEAASTYEQVRGAYARIFDRILSGGASMPGSSASLWKGWRAAEADTGAIGGHRSHEYHMEDSAGEDHLLSCSNTAACSYAANVERAVSLPSKAKSLPHDASEVEVHLFGPPPTSSAKGATHMITGGTLHAVVLRKLDTLNDVKMGKLLAPSQPSMPSPICLWTEARPTRTHSTDNQSWDWVERPEGPLVRFSSLDIVSDSACSSLDPEQIEEAVERAVVSYASSRPSGTAGAADGSQPRLADFFPSQLQADPSSPSAAQLPLRHIDVRTAEEGDTCATCRQGTLIQHRAVEVGHTFLLGTRYSDALEVGFAPVASKGGSVDRSVSSIGGSGRIPFQMGCYGIGVTRLVGILAQRASAAFATVQQAQAQDAKPSAALSGLLWPPSVAPFSAVVVVASPLTPEKEAALALLTRQLAEGTFHDNSGGDQSFTALPDSDILIDDRASISLGAKLKDADLLGCSRVYILGKHWEKTGEVEFRAAGQVPSYLRIA